jgi:NitT/TauT family transport system permease protein
LEGKKVFFGLNAQPGLKLNIFLVLLPFIIFIMLYLTASNLRLKENPKDKLLPSFSKMADAIKHYGFTKDERSKKFILWYDTFSSLKRLTLGILLSSFVGLFIGLNMGVYPGFKSLGLSFVNFISIIPPLAILPILFISFGTGELGKVMLIFIGTFPMITRDIFITVKKIPKEMITKSLTLGASENAITYRIFLPQILPRLIDTIRLTLGAAWVYLIASEAIASTNGLGYRIFLVRRYLAMDVIIPYVLWITFIGFFIDWILKLIIQNTFVWYQKK